MSRKLAPPTSVPSKLPVRQVAPHFQQFLEIYNSNHPQSLITIREDPFDLDRSEVTADLMNCFAAYFDRQG